MITKLSLQSFSSLHAEFLPPICRLSLTSSPLLSHIFIFLHFFSTRSAPRETSSSPREPYRDNLPSLSTGRHQPDQFQSTSLPSSIFSFGHLRLRALKTLANLPPPPHRPQAHLEPLSGSSSPPSFLLLPRAHFLEGFFEVSSPVFRPTSRVTTLCGSSRRSVPIQKYSPSVCPPGRTHPASVNALRK